MHKPRQALSAWLPIYVIVLKKYEDFIEYFVLCLIEYKWDMSKNIIYFYCMLANNGFIHACELNILK